MKIKEEDFEGGGEIDIKVGHQTQELKFITTGYRISIRKRDGKYELYKHYFTPHNINFVVDEVIFADKDLKKVIEKSNELYGMNDEVV